MVLLRDAVGVGGGERLKAELDGRMAVGTQVLIVEVGEVQVLDSGELSVLAHAAKRLQDEHCGSVVLRNASARLLGQLRLMRLDHMFELEI
ncbi:MAG: STAS domain-containing protein [Acidimicrobiales bacterium]